MKADGEAWARDIERAIDRDLDPLASRITTKDSFASLINRHMDDLATYGKPLRRSKEAVLRRLEPGELSQPIRLGKHFIGCQMQPFILCRGRAVQQR